MTNDPRSSVFIRTARSRGFRAALLLIALAYGIGVQGHGSPSAHADIAPAAVAIEGDRELGEYLAAECMTCHQMSGQNDGIPSIVGLEPGHFIDVLKSYREHRRDNTVMRTVAAKFSDAEIAALAVYFASIQPKP